MKEEAYDRREGGVRDDVVDLEDLDGVQVPIGRIVEVRRREDLQTTQAEIAHLVAVAWEMRGRMRRPLMRRMILIMRVMMRMRVR